MLSTIGGKTLAKLSLTKLCKYYPPYRGQQYHYCCDRNNLQIEILGSKMLNCMPVRYIRIENAKMSDDVWDKYKQLNKAMEKQSGEPENLEHEAQMKAKAKANPNNEKQLEMLVKELNDRIQEYEDKLIRAACAEPFEALSFEDYCKLGRKQAFISVVDTPKLWPQFPEEQNPPADGDAPIEELEVGMPAQPLLAKTDMAARSCDGNDAIVNMADAANETQANGKAIDQDQHTENVGANHDDKKTI